LTISIVVLLFALLFWIMALTVPMISATAPLLIAVILTALGVLIWMKSRKEVV
jgi:hypothetical protein